MLQVFILNIVQGKQTLTLHFNVNYCYSGNVKP